MAKAWSYWLPDLLPHVAGVPVLIAEHELLRAAQKFFEGSRAWQATLPAAAVAANQSTVTPVFADTGQELVRVEQAWYDGKPLDITTADDLDAELGDDWTTHTGTPSRFLQLTPGVVTLYPVPNAAAATGLKLRVSIKPSDAATGLPDEMAVKFRDGIHIGAKARLMIYKDKPWTDYNAAAGYATAFESSVTSANIDAARSFGSARKPARPKWC